MRITAFSAYLVFLLSALGLTACPQDVVTNLDVCTEHIDCDGIQLCIEGFCRDPVGATCEKDTDCPDGLRCVDDGKCRAGVECIYDADCCAPGAECTTQCEDYKCIGSACESGDSRACFVGCHRGERNCEQGRWTLCNAPPVTADEKCDDDIDNNCNGQINEQCNVCTPGETRDCENACGSGVETCTNGGDWGVCDAPTECICEPGETRTQECGNCGYVEQVCGTDGLFGESGLCLGEGLCAPGEEDTRACGNCGVQTRTCSDECSWGEWSECDSSASECVPGTTEQQGCGTCGSQTRTCSFECTFSEWGTCDENQGCSPGETQSQACGRCGQRVSTCDDQCGWSDYGACTGEGVCEPGEVQTESCGRCGTRQRSCGNTCSWGDWGSCSDEGECAPGDVELEECGPDTTEGICERGNRLRTCTENCQWDAPGTCDGAVYPEYDICGNGIDESCTGADSRFEDEFEPNDTCASCYWLGDDPAEMTLYPTYDAYSDRSDWFCFRGIDNFSVVGFTEDINIRLTGIPQNMDLDMTLYRGSDCGSLVTIGSGVNLGQEDESIQWGEGVGNDDSTTFYIEVTGYGEPDCYFPYNLFIDGLR